MSIPRSKKTSKQTKVGAARKGSPIRHSSKFKRGDRVRITNIAEYLKDPNYDLKDEGYRQMRTAELFRFCIGREFTVGDLDQYGHVEIDASANRAVRKEFGKYHMIWSEPEYLEHVGSVKKGRSR